MDEKAAIPDESASGRICPKCSQLVSKGYRYCPHCAMALTPAESVFAMDSFVRDLIEKQVRERMKDDRLVAAEVTDKVLKNLRWSLLPLLLFFALLGWIGYTNLRDAAKPITDKAVQIAQNALAVANQANTNAVQSASSVKVAEETAASNESKINQFNIDSAKKLNDTKEHLAAVETNVNASSSSLSGRFKGLETTASTMEKQLNNRADELKSYEQRVSALDKHVGELSIRQQFPGVGDVSVAAVKNQILDGKEKKPGETYIVFNYTYWAVNADMMKTEDIHTFEDVMKSDGFKVFAGPPTYGKASGPHFEVTPFKQNTFNNGVWVQYFDSNKKEQAQRVYDELAKYVKMSSKSAELVEEQEYKTGRDAKNFIVSSGMDVYVEVNPTR